MAGIRRKSKQAFVLCGAAVVGKTVAAFWFTSAFCSDSTNERGQSPALSRLAQVWLSALRCVQWMRKSNDKS